MGYTFMCVFGLQMQASLQYRPQERSLGMVMKEVDEDLAIFLEMRRHEKENSDLNLIQKSNDYHDSLGYFLTAAFFFFFPPNLSEANKLL